MTAAESWLTIAAFALLVLAAWLAVRVVLLTAALARAVARRLPSRKEGPP